MTDENKKTENLSDDDALEASSRRRRARNRVVEYAEADGDLKVEMERIMKPISLNPDSFEAIITYGHEPLKDLGVIADQLISVQARFDSQVNVMGDAMEKLQNAFSKHGIKDIGEAAKNLADAALNAGAKTVGSGFKMGKGVLDSLTGAKKKRDAKRVEEEKMLENLQTKIPDMMREMKTLTESIADIEHGLKEVIVEAEKLGVARGEATRKLNTYIGAGKEVLRRYNDEYIPEAQENFEESNDPEDELYLQNVLKRKEDFVNQLTVLEGSRTQGVIAMQQLKQMMDMMEEQIKQTQQIRYSSQNEWKAMMAAAGIAGSSLKAAQTLRQGQEFGDKVHDETFNMIEGAHKITLDGKGRATVDPQKLILATQRLTKMIEAEQQQRERSVKKLEETKQALRGAADKLIEASQGNEERRLLEAVKSAEEESAKTRKSVSNDNKDAVEPAAEEISSRPRRAGNNGGPKL